MSKERGGANSPSIHVEWAPGRVQAVDVSNGRRRTAATLGELTSFFSGHKSILVGISRQQVFMKAVALPKAAPDDLRRILSIQLGQHFPLPSDQLSFDFYQTNVRSDDGFVTMLAAVRAVDLRQLADEMKNAGVRAARILPVALGAIAVAAHAQSSAALVVEEATGVGYALDVVADGVVRLSRTVASEGGDLVREVQRTLAASGAIGGGMALISAGAADSGSLGALARLTDAKSESRTALELLHEAPPFTFELAEQRELERRKQLAGHNRLAVLLLVASLGVVAVVWDIRSGAAANTKRAQGQWTALITKDKAINADWEKQAADAVAKQKTLATAFHVAQPMSDMASFVGDSLPAKSWLTGIDLQRGKVAQIRGTTSVPEDVARLLKTLGDSGRLRDVQLVVASSGKISSQPIVQFSLSGFPVGNLPMPVPALKKPGARPTPASAEGGGTQ